MNITFKRRENGKLNGHEPRRTPRRPVIQEALDRTSIAELSATLIDRMTCEELVRLIRVAALPTLGGAEFQRRLPYYDRETLKRLAHLAWRCCQQKTCDSSRDESAEVS